VIFANQILESSISNAYQLFKDVWPILQQIDAYYAKQPIYFLMECAIIMILIAYLMIIKEFAQFVKMVIYLIGADAYFTTLIVYNMIQTIFNAIER